MEMAQTASVVMVTEGRRIPAFDALARRHGTIVATRLYGFLVLFVQLGEEAVRARFEEPTYRKYLRQLRQAGIDPWRCVMDFPKGWRGSVTRWLYETQGRVMGARPRGRPKRKS